MRRVFVSIFSLLWVSLAAYAEMAGVADLTDATDVASGPGTRTGSAWTGVVFVDTNANGVRDLDEPARSEVRVSNGISVQITGEDGRYAFDDTADGFVRITRPDDFECAHWYRRIPGDFALTPQPTPDDFFFIQISDTHAYADARDFARYSLPEAPKWIPSLVGAYGMLWAMWSYYDNMSHAEIASAFAEALTPWEDPRGLSNSEVLLAYMQEFERPGSILGDVVTLQRLALLEVAALGPEFVVSTGDLVLESNTAPGGSIVPWFTLYGELTASTRVPFYDTIGNNEIAGSRLDAFDASDLRYGKRLYERFRGPTTYSFDRGAFHFVAIDSHLEIPRKRKQPKWKDDELGERVKEWVDADMAAHPDRVLVALNHEPFHSLPEWSFYDPVDDRGLFAKHRVAYSLAGHIHLNGTLQIGDTTHITTGALSGMRWVVPPSLHPRGYRLFYARGRRLYSVWKETGMPVVAFVHPAADDAHFATGDPPPAEHGGTPLVGVAADVLGPFHALELSLAGEPLPFERWGDYFLRAELPIGARASDVELRGVRANGERVSTRLSPSR